MHTVSGAIRRTETQDGAILLDVERGRMLCLNPVGSKILELVARGLDEAQITREISRTYNEPIETVRADVREFLEALRQHAVLQESKAATKEERDGIRSDTDQT
jgi:DNA-binding transcriptional LysR family regulator